MREGEEQVPVPSICPRCKQEVRIRDMEDRPNYYVVQHQLYHYNCERAKIRAQREDNKDG
ncbi:hypothetical protein LCGC14_2547480 [marine sediment metagenome]|uniref:Uncharacterized protein n=1 Tax=marine sediment metagenome TaxID=412755 RepID=A0A0F9DH07_9ZZZZ